jgi:hypothetical protein
MDKIKYGNEVIPVFVDKEYPSFIVDGNHRAEAYRRLGKPIPTVKIDYDTYRKTIYETGMSSKEYYEKNVKDKTVILQHGGPGSGWTAEEGHVPGSQGGSGEDESTKEWEKKYDEGVDDITKRLMGDQVHAEKVAKAKASYNPMNKEKKRIATENEVKVANITGGRHTLDSDAFDVVLPKSVVEVKTIVAGKNDKITMHPESIRRKQTLAKQMKMKGHTVVFDNRNGKIYYKKGFGSFRLGNMQEVSSLNELGRLLA